MNTWSLIKGDVMAHYIVKSRDGWLTTLCGHLLPHGKSDVVEGDIVTKCQWCRNVEAKR